MPGTHVDYDRIASTYNRRFVADRQDGVAAALLALARDLGAERILEVGCGTGRWLADFQPITRQLYGLDFSAGMLAQACERDVDLHLVRGRGGQLSYPDGTFDLIYCVNAIHHFDNQRQFVSEAHRLLRPGGALAVLGSDPHDRRDSWFAYDYFEGMYEMDLGRFPSWGTIVDWMVADGFERVEWRPVERILDPKIGRAVLDDPFLQKDSCSQLALLTDEAYAAGLRRIEAALAEAKAAGETLVFPVDILIGVLVGLVRESENVTRK